jgi:tetratricopeptide (TPR) repeat protein
MKKILIGVVVLSLLGLGAWAGRRTYRSWRADRALEMARTAFAKSDQKEGLLWLRKALQADANNLDAVRLMADVAEASQNPAQLAWRQRLVDLQPAATNRLRLAQAALDLRDLEGARKALLSVEERDRKLPEYLKILGALALSSGRIPEAEAHLRQAIQANPTDPYPRVNLGMLLVHSQESAKNTEGLVLLESLRTNSAVATEALRQLSLEAFRRTNLSRSLQFAQELVRDTNVSIKDRVLELSLLAASSNATLQSRLEAHQLVAVGNVNDAFELGRWMLSFQGPRSTFVWLDTLPARSTTNPPVALVVSDALVGLQAWTNLQGRLSAQEWGDLECLRYTYLSRALREQNLEVASKAEWTKAMKTAGGELELLRLLEQAAANWGWKTEWEEVMTGLVNRFPALRTERQRLADFLFQEGRTRALLTLFASEVTRDPSNLAAKNNLAALALLLSAQEHKPHELAKEVYAKDPSNPSVASTYAYSLLLQKQKPEALKVLEGLKPEALKVPGIAGYYGLCLLDSGDKSKAHEYLRIALSARLLPEETKLFQGALNQ